MSNLWKQSLSGRFGWVLFCTLVLGFAFAGLIYYNLSRDNLPTGVPMTTAATRDLPLIDQLVVEQTEFALFALG